VGGFTLPHRPLVDPCDHGHSFLTWASQHWAQRQRPPWFCQLLPLLMLGGGGEGRGYILAFRDPTHIHTGSSCQWPCQEMQEPGPRSLGL
jgi:hypothetical protein